MILTNLLEQTKFFQLSYRTLQTKPYHTLVFIPKAAKATHSKPKHYRSISLSFLKTLEWLIDLKLTSFSDPSIVNGTQHASLKSKSVESVLHDVKEALELSDISQLLRDWIIFMLKSSNINSSLGQNCFKKIVTRETPQLGPYYFSYDFSQWTLYVMQVALAELSIWAKEKGLWVDTEMTELVRFTR